MNPPSAPSAAARRLGPQGRPLSPCMSVCVIAADGFCSGCLRTLDEIARWAVMSADDQWLVMARLERRLAQRDGKLPLER